TAEGSTCRSLRPRSAPRPRARPPSGRFPAAPSAARTTSRAARSQPPASRGQPTCLAAAPVARGQPIGETRERVRDRDEQDGRAEEGGEVEGRVGVDLRLLERLDRPEGPDERRVL